MPSSAATHDKEKASWLDTCYCFFYSVLGCAFSAVSTKTLYYYELAATPDASDAYPRDYRGYYTLKTRNVSYSNDCTVFFFLFVVVVVDQYVIEEEKRRRRRRKMCSVLDPTKKRELMCNACINYTTDRTM